MPSAPKIKRFYSHGKLLLTGEYFVLDGAVALAVPTRKGQSLTVEKLDSTEPHLVWESYTCDGECWFSGRFSLPDGTHAAGADSATGQRLEQILKAGQELQGQLWREPLTNSFRVRTTLEFPRDWGLGSSSTLIANLAKWWQIDAYELLRKTFGGSGYDLACADAEGPIFYRLEHGQPIITPATFQPPFRDQLYFLYLENKQDSRAGIKRYRERGRPPTELLDRISSISEDFTQSGIPYEFSVLLEEHEWIIAQFMALEPVRKQLFPDFLGHIKSLGAWGGDFVLVVSGQSFPDLERYFSAKGYHTLIPFAEMILGAENA